MSKLQLDDVRNFVRSGGYFSTASAIMADFVLRNANCQSAELYLAMALTVNAVQNGSVCIKLAELANKHIYNGEYSLLLPEFDEWFRALTTAPCRGTTALAGKDTAKTLAGAVLVLDLSGNCYLQRQWQFESVIVQTLTSRGSQLLPLPEILPGKLHHLVSFFPDAISHPEMDCQQLAVLAALRHKLLILSGGPGTGKTTVAAAILALKLEQNSNLRIKLTAPTAKAAARLQESMLGNLKNLNTDTAVKDTMRQLESSTIHRLLGYKHNSHEFKHNCHNQLECDLLLVDECSMVPQHLMARLLEALPPEADLILLGDRYQLPSVEAGSVMAEICQTTTPNQVDPLLAEAFAGQTTWQVDLLPEKPQSRIDGCLIELTENHRFALSACNIGTAAALIRNMSGKSDCQITAETIAALQGDDIEFIESKQIDIRKYLQRKLSRPRLISGESFMDLAHLASTGSADDRAKAFKLLASFKLLAPAIKGALGVESLNDICMELLGLHDMHDVGMPLIITINDYNVDLFNSDIGLVALDENKNKRVYFSPDDPGCSIAELPEHNAVFAMTVHKSQGSGFGEVVFVMPAGNHELMTREMVYTAMTRAEKHLSNIGSVEVLAQALANETHRTSNLRQRLKQ